MKVCFLKSAQLKLFLTNHIPKHDKIIVSSTATVIFSRTWIVTNLPFFCKEAFNIGIFVTKKENIIKYYKVISVAEFETHLLSVETKVKLINQTVHICFDGLVEFVFKYHSLDSILEWKQINNSAQWIIFIFPRVCTKKSNGD